MFEIPDDDDGFWENLPLDIPLGQSKTICSASTPSTLNKQDGHCVSDTFNGRLPLSSLPKPNVNSDTRNFGNASGKNGSDINFLNKISSTGSCTKPTKSAEKEGFWDGDSVVSTPGCRTDSILTKPRDLFNLTQSSDSDFDLSFNSDCDTKGSNSVAKGSNHTKNLEKDNLANSSLGLCNNRQVSINPKLSKPDSYGAKTSNSSPLVRKQYANGISKDSAVFLTPQSCKTGYIPRTPQCRIDTPMSLQTTPVKPSQEVRVEKQSPFCSNSKAKRKFPGPAGLLPKLAPGQTLDTNQVLILNSPQPQKKDESPIPSSQSTEDMFQDPPWQMLQADLGEECHAVLKAFCIEDTLTKARQKQLANGKVPLLFVVVDALDIHGADGSVTLKDKTGKMQGTVHRDLLRESECQFHQGAVVVLKNVAVICPTPRSHYLNITPSNVISLYRSNADGTASVSLNHSNTLTSIVHDVQVQLRETPAIVTPKLGHLLSQPQTPIHRVQSSPALFETVQQSSRYNSGLQGPQQFQARTPQYQPNTPQYQPRTPQYQQTTPQYQPRTPQYQQRTPQYQPRTPQHQQRTPQYQQRTPQYQQRTPQYQPRSTQFETRTSQLQPGTPQQSRDPQQQPRTPQYLPGTTQYLSTTPQRNPQYQQTVVQLNPKCRNMTPQVESRTSQLRPAVYQHQEPINSELRSKHYQESDFQRTEIERTNIPIPPAMTFNFSSEDPSVPTEGDYGTSKGDNFTSSTPKGRSKWTFKSRNSPALGSVRDPTQTISSPLNSCQTPTLNMQVDNKRTQCSANILSGDSNNNKFRLVQNNGVVNGRPPPTKAARFNTNSNRLEDNQAPLKPTSNHGNNHMEIDNLWQDDLTDELLSELTADDFP